MKRIIIICGLIAGVLVSGFMTFSMLRYRESMDGHGSMLVGYASMILAFSLIFVGIKNYRDNHQAGSISFGKGFKIGLFIALIASTLYVITWMLLYYNVMPDFMDRYAEYELKTAREQGVTGDKLQKMVDEMEGYKEMYKNPLFIFLFTYLEILPVGIIISLIAALILKRKNNLESASA